MAVAQWIRLAGGESTTSSRTPSSAPPTRAIRFLVRRLRAVMRGCARRSSVWCGRTNARPAFSRGRPWPTPAACFRWTIGQRRVVHPDGTDQVEAEFRGTERFTVLRRLGAGGMGVVYAVHDGVRDEAVALKTLLRARPADVSRLKREFRSLADIAHPNVVCLYELVVEPDTLLLHDGAGGGPRCVGVRPSNRWRTQMAQVRRASAPIRAW